jgi:hypothetical protein
MEQRYPGSASVVSTAKRTRTERKGNLEDMMGLALIMLCVHTHVFVVHSS